VSYFKHELAAVLALLLFFLHTLAAVRVRFVLALVGNFLDALFFFPGFICRKWLVVLGNQALDLLSVNDEHFRRPRFDLLDIAMAIEFVLLFALNVGVVAQAFLVFQILLRNEAEKFADLLLRDG